MKYDVVALGELLIDFTEMIPFEDDFTFKANPGGAPCNVLAMLAKLNKKTAFIGKVGDDIFGHFLQKAVEEAGISTEGIVADPSVSTTLAFVNTLPDGDREFSFFRKPGADTMLTASEVSVDLLANCSIFHFGSLSLTDEPAREATQHAVALAKESSALISFDPNLRPLLWKDMQQAKAQIAWGCAQCDILKIADEELLFLTGCDDIYQGVNAVRSIYPDIRIIFVTRGKHGAECFYKGMYVTHPAFLEVRTVDTTGAGDTFCGVCLAFLLDKGLDELCEEDLYKMLRHANAAASLVTAKKGTISVMPTAAEVEELLGHASIFR